MKMNFGKVIFGVAMLAGVTAPAVAQHWDGDRYEQRWDDDRGRYNQRYDRFRDAPRWDDAGWRERRNEQVIERRIFSDPLLRRQAFRNFDRNRDGRLDPHERRQLTRYVERIADLNRDGFVSGREFDRARSRILNRDYANRW